MPTPVQKIQCDQLEAACLKIKFKENKNPLINLINDTNIQSFKVCLAVCRPLILKLNLRRAS